MPKDFHGYFITYWHMVRFLDERSDIVSYGANSHVMQIFGSVIANYDMFDKTEDPKLNSGKLIRYMSRTMMRRSNSISVKEREKSIYGIKERKKEGNT